MRALLLALAAAAASLVGGAAAAAPAARARGHAPVRAHAPTRDWTKVVVATPEGGFRVGRPDAPVKLIEYGSLTCSHCAHFAEAGVPVMLRKYVAPGRVSYEFRNFVRDPYDLTAALLSRCAGARGFFTLGNRYFAKQDAWIARFEAITDAQSKEIEALPENQRFARLAAVGGLDTMAASVGVPAARAKQCLLDPAGLKALLDIRGVADATYKIDATPTFIVNGKKTGAYDWAALEPLLGPPGG
jgi:protein-disulfide isomerase